MEMGWGREKLTVMGIVYFTKCLYTQLAMCMAVHELTIHTADPNNTAEIIPNLTNVTMTNHTVPSPQLHWDKPA